MFDDPEDTAPIGKINFDMMSVEASVINYDQIEIKPNGSEKALRFRLKDPKNLCDWALALYNTRKVSLGAKMNLSVASDLYLYENYITQS